MPTDTEVEDRDGVVYVPRPLAFRCRNCGRLEGPDVAGENSLPHACSMCGAGIVLNPRTAELAEALADPDLPADRRRGIAAELAKLARVGENEKHADPDNWEVLADLDDEALESYGVVRAHVVPPHAEFEAEVADDGGEPRRVSLPVRQVVKGPVRGRTLSMTLGADEHLQKQG